VLMAVPSASAAGPTPDPFFGTWSDGMSLIAQQGNTASSARLDDLSSVGVGMVRQYVWWDRIETSPGSYDWAVMDELVKEATARGVTILPTFLYTPTFYRPQGTSNIYPPTDPQKLATFATAMVKRYGPNGTYWKCQPLLGCPQPYKPITMWEVWNEPDYPSWWKGRPNAADYLDLLKATHDAVKAADPAAQVVLGAMTNAGGSNSDGYLDELYGLGAKDYFDVLSLNPYALDVGALMALIKAERDIATKYGDAAKPILLTEWGWSTGSSHPYTVTDEGCQAALIYKGASEIYARRTELNVIGANQFQWQDAAPSGGTGWPNYAGVRTFQGTAKPSRAAYAAAIAQQPPPPGATLAEACPADRQSTDGTMQAMDITRSGTGSGAVDSNPRGISCPADCHQDWQPGMTITLTATPDADSYVSAWQGAPGCTGTTCTVTMDSAKDVGVTFSALATKGIHQEDDDLLTYSGAWHRRADSRDRGGAALRTTTGPASATLEFQGTRIKWIARKAPSAGKARVYVDGARVATVSLYSATNQFAVPVFASSSLPDGRHTIRVEFSGTKERRATNDAVWLDAFVVR
jgi:hypothetical protein